MLRESASKISFKEDVIRRILRTKAGMVIHVILTEMDAHIVLDGHVEFPVLKCRRVLRRDVRRRGVFHIEPRKGVGVGGVIVRLGGRRRDGRRSLCPRRNAPGHGKCHGGIGDIDKSRGIRGDGDHIFRIGARSGVFGVNLNTPMEIPKIIDG